MSKIIGYLDATIGTICVTEKRRYHIYEEGGKVCVDALLNEGESSKTLGFVPECNDRYCFGEYKTFEEAVKAIEEDI